MRIGTPRRRFCWPADFAKPVGAGITDRLRERRVCAGDDHAVDYGRDGALILSATFDDAESDFQQESSGWRWAPAAAQNLASLVLAAGPGAARRDLAWDLIAAIGGDAPEPRPSRAVRRVREAIDDAPHQARLDDLAAQVNLHRVYLSRAFAATYGVSLSVYRGRRMMARAAASICRGTPLAEAAAEAGFADQSHMVRTFRRHIGATPSRLRHLLEVTSVQAGEAPWG